MERKELKTTEIQLADDTVSTLAKWLKTSTQNNTKMQVDAATMYPNYLTRFYYPFTDATFYANTSVLGSFAKITNKPQRERTSFSDNHLQTLEDCFAETKHPDTNRREKLARKLGLRQKTVQIWFQNRRAKERRCLDKEKTNPQKVTPKAPYENCFPLSVGSENNNSSTVPNRQDISQSLQCFYGKTSVNNKPTYQEMITRSEPKDQIFQNDATVVQEIDSSERYSSKNSTHLAHQEEKRFTIVHIPEVSSTKESRTTCSGLCKEHVNPPNQDNKEDQNYEVTFSSNVVMPNFDTSLNLDLLVNTYEVLLSSHNADLLITKWLTELGLQQGETNGNNSTLEENLKRFINYCQSSLIDEN